MTEENYVYCSAPTLTPDNSFVCYTQAFFGAGAAALGLIVTAPFSNIEGPSLSLPSVSGGRPAVEKVAKKPSAAKPAKKSTGPKGYNLDVSDDVSNARKAAKAEAQAAKKAAQEKIAAEKAAAKQAAAEAAKSAKAEGK